MDRQFVYAFPLEKAQISKDVYVCLQEPTLYENICKQNVPMKGVANSEMRPLCGLCRIASVMKMSELISRRSARLQSNSLRKFDSISLFR